MTTVSISSTLIERPALFNTSTYNVAELQEANVVTAVAGGAGQSVTTSFVFSDLTSLPPLDDNGNPIYTIMATPSVVCAVNYAAKTQYGFNIIQTPLSSGVTLAAGTMDVVVNWPNGGAA